MLMNNHISFATEGINKPGNTEADIGIRFEKFVIRFNDRGDQLICTGNLVVGDTTITIHFSDDTELALFCIGHNIEYDYETLPDVDDANLVGQTFYPSD